MIMSMMQKMKILSQFCLDLMYPNRCPCCDIHIKWNEFLCEKCKNVILIEDGILCPFCGKSHNDCICNEDDMKYDEAIVLSWYEEEAKKGIIEAKLSENCNFMKYAGYEIGKRILENEQWNMADAIVPVPMSKNDFLLRGVNPAECIAREISSVTHIPLYKNWLKKKNGGQKQHMLSRDERAENVKQFYTEKHNLNGYTVILCDDILTTGSTMNRCAELLKSNGVKTVIAALAATTKRKENEIWQQQILESTSEQLKQ